jgi:pre-mRNA-splicing factor SYF1
MHKMPRIWFDYAKFMASQGHISRTRRIYDRALQSLPITQHALIWQFYLKWALSLQEVHPHTAKAVYQRYL